MVLGKFLPRSIILTPNSNLSEAGGNFPGGTFPDTYKHFHPI